MMRDAMRTLKVTLIALMLSVMLVTACAAALDVHHATPSAWTLSAPRRGKSDAEKRKRQKAKREAKRKKKNLRDRSFRRKFGYKRDKKSKFGYSRTTHGGETQYAGGMTDEARREQEEREKNKPKPPKPFQPMDTYRIEKAQYDRDMAAWNAGTYKPPTETPAPTPTPPPVPTPAPTPSITDDMRRLRLWMECKKKSAK